MIRIQPMFAAVIFALLQLINSEATACELIKNFGSYQLVGENCFSVRPQYTLKSPNILASGAGVSYGSPPDFTIGVTLINNGDLSTSENLLPLALILGNPAGPNDGTFDVSIEINVRDMSGHTVLFYDETNGAYFYTSRWVMRADELQAHSFRYYALSSRQFSLPDMDNHYDICITVWADPVNAGSIRGEIVESDERDNVYSGFARLPGQSVPPNFEPSFCDDYSGEEII